jgi:FkbM family methyltransferase
VSRFVEAHYLAQAVEQVWKYVLLELATRRTARYTPRGNTVDVWLRHRTSDGNIAQEINTHHLYDPPPAVTAILDEFPRLRVVDLGAHVGLFAARILTLYPHAHVDGVEMDKGTFAVLERAASRHPAWSVTNAAAWTSAGETTYTSNYAETRVDPDGANTVETIDALELIRDADFVKIDIEGAEWPIFADPRFRETNARVIVLEWHPQMCPAADPSAAAHGELADAGFTVTEIPDANWADDVGMLWAYR